MKASDTHLPYFTSPSIFMGKIWSPPLFFENFETQFSPLPVIKEIILAEMILAA